MFCIQPEYGSSREAIAVIQSSSQIGVNWFISKDSPRRDCVPIGSVEYCEKFLPQREEVIDFYPKFLKPYYCRRIGFINIPNTLPSPLTGFIKKATEYKSEFKSRVYSQGEEIPNGLYYVSQIVAFLQEWRYYISDGAIVTTGWYDGIDEEEPAPKLDINWPKDFNGAVDFGRLDTGEIALVESHPPFSCGWYGDNHLDFVKWQYKAWFSYKKELV